MLIAIAAVAVALIATSVAYAAALNTYTATISGKTSAGTTTNPGAFSFSEKLTAQNATPNMRAGVLKDISLKVSGLKTNYQDFKTVCTAAQIAAAQNDAACPHGALVASGSIQSVLGDHTLQVASSDVNCDPVLHVWNGGNGKLVFFFVITATHACTGLQTGAAAPYVGTIKQVGSSIVQDTPLPPDVSTNAGNVGLYGSLEVENLTWQKLTTKVGGKTVPFIQSTSCTAHQRNFAVTFKAVGPTGAVTTSTISNKAAC
jgi:hypothetical protein